MKLVLFFLFGLLLAAPATATAHAPSAAPPQSKWQRRYVTKASQIFTRGLSGHASKKTGVTRSKHLLHPAKRLGGIDPSLFREAERQASTTQGKRRLQGHLGVI